jgi:cytochrome c-type biogenesis protein CcmF
MMPNFSTAWLGEGALYLAALSSFKFLLRPQTQRTSCFISFFLLSSLGVLIYAHVIGDFSYLNVIEHGHTHQTLLYKIVGIWGNHEGSLLLWITELSVYQVLAAYFLPRPNRQVVNQVISCLLLVFIIFIIISCNPFITVLNPPSQGEGLNPALQDPSLVFHPPFLYAGYTGAVIPFALGLHALFKKHLDLATAQAMRRWTIVSWTFLTLGLGLGSFWAYYELGWGGWWFWDPVETISILPWLTATALIHNLAGYPNHIKSSLRLAIIGFIFCLTILFFVRSGLLNSVHSFAVDTERGVLLFSILAMVTSAALFVWLKNRRNFVSEPWSIRLSFSALITQQNYLIGLSLITLLLGIIYPLLAEFWQESLTINPWYFQVTFIPLMLPMLLGIGLGPWLIRGTGISYIYPALTATLAVWVIIFWWWDEPSIALLGILALCVGVWIVISHLFYVVKAGISLKISGMIIAHFGVGVAIIGIVVATYGQVSQTISLSSNHIVKLIPTGWTLKLNTVEDFPGLGYNAKQAVVSLYSGQEFIKTLKPERRYYTAAKVIHTEVAFYSHWLSHLYIVLLDDGGEPYTFQVEYKPLINLLWLGVLMMVAGGMAAALYHWSWKTKKKRQL